MTRRATEDAPGSIHPAPSAKDAAALDNVRTESGPASAPPSCLDVAKLRELNTTLQTTDIQLMQVGALFLLAIVALGLMFGPDIMKHGVHLTPFAIVASLVGGAGVLVTIYRVTLRYEFGSGLVRCWWYGRLQWEHELASLRLVEERSTRGGNYLVFVWPDMKRNVYLFVDDFGELASIKERE